MPALDPVALLQALIRERSVTPDSAGALDRVEDVLSSLGFRCWRLPFQSPDMAEVDNLFARLGEASPHFCFAGHVDVVPPGDESRWTHPPFAGMIDDGVIYGRGAVDMKGSVAAFCAAVSSFIGKQGADFGGSISLLITGDEEGPAVDGTVKVLEWMAAHGHRPDACLVGEPSCSEALGDTLRIGRRGSLHARLTVFGRQGHVAYPHKADNPIPKLVRMLDRLASHRLDDGNAYFEPSTLAITSVDVGNTVENVIPDRAHAAINIRYNSEHSRAGLEHWITAVCDQVKSEMGGEYRLAFSSNADSFVTEPGALVDLVAGAIAECTGVTPALSTGGGTSDARFVKDYCPVVEFGPVNATIHQTDERIPAAELAATTRIYERILERYFQR
ncbi:succinyl-diaminopimelate desuccinylase [Rhodoligotrophos defluvii]|uniref:succinyl-diaminopimelate desuccinylase n=1 Tax=Rhodoligotrophos defluvii TaxID=2561934 RepID=UPI0010C98154|nr:succinyl-diaminopimelate desuccinylase [Rhodoligotrophos defluvii]